MPKYYIAKLIGLKKNFVFKSSDESLARAIYNAPKEDYGEFIFVKTVGGYKEVLTGKKFKFQYGGPDFDGYPYFSVPTDKGIFVDKNTEREIPKAKAKEKVEEYKKKLNKDQLLDFFEETEKDRDALVAHGPNKTPYYVAKLVGLKEGFTHNPANRVSYSVYQAPKENYGEYIFAQTVGGYKELITGKFFKYINDGYDAGPYYEAPKNTGLMVDKRTAVAIPKSQLDKKVEEYKKNHNEIELLEFFDKTQEKCDEYLAKGIIDEEHISLGGKK